MQVEGLLSVSVVDTVSVRALLTKYKPLVLTGILQKHINSFQNEKFCRYLTN